MAKPRTIKDVESLKAAINAYFKSVDDYNKSNETGEKMYYTWPDMLLSMNMTESGIKRWINEPDKYPGFLEQLEIAEMKMQAQLTRTGLNDGKKTGIIAFLLKQKHYGGFTDKPISAADSINVNVNLQGMGHKDAFG